jgi:hypothetical protein
MYVMGTSLPQDSKYVAPQHDKDQPGDSPVTRIPENEKTRHFQRVFRDRKLITTLERLPI